jgi:quinol monooxygenase YgiN
MDETNDIYLLSIFGRMAPKTKEAARAIHNQTAGAPANIAAARSLSDLSHMVYVPVDDPGPQAGELLFLDQWNNLDGLNQFFSNHHVQEQGALIFSERDPVVWKPAEGFTSYHFPAPYGKNERFIGVVRGMVRSRDDARASHNTLVGMSVNKARAAGNLSHEAYFRLTPPGTPESLEFFAVDVWMDGPGMEKQYDDPEFMSGFQQMFAAPPMTSVWVRPSGDWVEW